MVSYPAEYRKHNIMGAKHAKQGKILDKKIYSSLHYQS